MKILIRLPNWLGDVVMSTAFINAVKQVYPDAVIDIIIKKELSGIASLIPGLHVIHPFAKQEYKNLTGVFRFGKKLRSEKYDLFFNLPSSLSSMVMAWATNAKKRIGFSKEGGYFLLTNSYKKAKNIHRVDEYISLLHQFTDKNISSGPVALNIAQPVQRNNKVIINFNSEAESRRMPVDKAKAIINLLTNTFPVTTFTFIGSQKEAAFIEQIIEGAENKSRIENTAGKTDLIGLCSIMAASKAVLTTDSGPAHLANSVGTPTIVLFGAGNEYNTAPFNKQDLSVIRYGKLSCEPCAKNTCELYGIPKCMQMINELTIIEALNVYLLHA
ncbi:MAG: heptosyltransferase [Mucilaginibacter sp.]|nr:heptosyltransferase [Mucilaginibacter sp.]